MEYLVIKINPIYKFFINIHMIVLEKHWVADTPLKEKWTKYK